MPKTDLPDRSQIGDQVGRLITRQSYIPGPDICGVTALDLAVHGDDGGSFAELIRCDEHGVVERLPEFTVRQSNFSEVLPGAVKAWHLHFCQEDLFFVPYGHRLLVGLYDVRKDSPTFGNARRLTLGGTKAQLLYIPRGVAHGVANPWTQVSFLLYFVNQQFDREKPDEYRLPWDLLGAAFWEIQRG